jgi:hypothetical protein
VDHLRGRSVQIHITTLAWRVSLVSIAERDLPRALPTEECPPSKSFLRRLCGSHFLGMSLCMLATMVSRHEEPNSISIPPSLCCGELVAADMHVVL